MIPERVERRARWVLDTIGARDLGFGDDVPYSAEAWEQVERGERPEGDHLAEAFFHLARVEERNGARDEHDRFRAASSCLDPLDPPLERLRAQLGVEPPRWGGARFAVALTHDVDVPWKWTRLGVKGAAARAKSDLTSGRVRPGLRELRGLAGATVHKVRGTDPYWSFDRILEDERRSGASSTFFLLADHAHEFDGAAAEAYERLRPQARRDAPGRQSGSRAPRQLLGRRRRPTDRRREGAARTALRPGPGPALPLSPHRPAPQSRRARGRGLRVRLVARLRRRGRLPGRNRASVPAVGLRAGRAARSDRGPARGHGRDAVRRAVPQPQRRAGRRAARAHCSTGPSEHGGGFAVLWHSEQYDSALLPGWDVLYRRLLEEVRARGGACLQAGALAEEARAWLS